MKISHGIDIIKVSRLKQSMTRSKTAFRDRVFTAGEQKYCEGKKRKFEHYAARFAAKEAVMKAFEIGKNTFFTFLDIEIKRRSTGKPYIYLKPTVAKKLKIKKNTQIELSMTHERDYAMASVIVCSV